MKMKKLWRSRKALSPVIAAIILIAVTVAVSIAVAAWMGALAFLWMDYEDVSFTDFNWATDLGHCNMAIKNSGTSVLTINKILVNNNLNTTTGWTVTTIGADRTLNPNEEVTIRILAGAYPEAAGITTDGEFGRGGTYAFTVVTAKNNPFGPYTKTAPS